MRSRLPVLRTRRRYLAFSLEAEGEIPPKELILAIRQAQLSLFGDFGASENWLRLITFNGRNGIIRCHHHHIEKTRAVLSTVHSIDGIKVALRTRGLSGTIKSATEKYLPRMSKISVENDGRRIELEEVSGCIIRTHGLEVDLCPDDRNKTMGSDTRYLGLTSFDLSGGH